MGARARLIPVIPAAITLGNMVCGFVAMAKAADAMQASGGTGPMDPAFARLILHAAYLIILGMVLDAFDGRIARMTGQTSSFGAMLDSLSDMVTFGVAPAFIAKVVYEHTMQQIGVDFRPGFTTSLCMLYVVGAALRLARFTSATGEDTDKDHLVFAGLPSPAAAGLIIATCIFVFEGRTELGQLWPNFAESFALVLLRGMPMLALVLGLLMVSRVPYVHIASRYVGHHMQGRSIVKIVLVIWFGVVFHEWSLLVCATVYVVGGLVVGLRARRKGRSPVDELPPPFDPGLEPSPSPSTETDPADS